MLRSLAIACVLCTARADGTWGPADSVRALDGVVASVEKLVTLPHLSAKQLEDAKHIAAEIKADVEAVESGKLSKDAAHKRVGDGLHHLAAFEKELERPRNVTGHTTMQDLKAKLSGKENTLKALEKKMQVLKLKKELVEKKLALQKLLAAKQGAGAESSAQEAATMAALGKELEAASSLLGSAKAAKALSSVRAEEQALQRRLAQLEDGQQKSEAMLKAALQSHIAAGGAAGSDTLVKGQMMLKELEKREKRKFAKARAQEQAELAGLREAEASLERRDAAGLRAAVSKIERHGKREQAKSGKFLY